MTKLSIPKLFDDYDRMYCFLHKNYYCRCSMWDRLAEFSIYRSSHPELESQFLERIKESNNDRKIKT